METNSPRGASNAAAAAATSSIVSSRSPRGSRHDDRSSSGHLANDGDNDHHGTSVDDRENVHPNRNTSTEDATTSVIHDKNTAVKQGSEASAHTLPPLLTKEQQSKKRKEKKIKILTPHAKVAIPKVGE
jgi:hypothetical protein